MEYLRTIKYTPKVLERRIWLCVNELALAAQDDGWAFITSFLFRARRTNYTLRVAPDQFPDAEMPTLEVVITDDFLFGQDLQLPFVVGDPE
jgi:hypothetical protein